jgi:hypothetical protein
MMNHEHSWLISSLCCGEGRLLGFERRVSHLLGRCFTTWDTPLTLFSFSYFWNKVLCFCPGLTLDYNHSTSASHVAGIAGTLHHSQLVLWDTANTPLQHWAGLKQSSYVCYPPKYQGLYTWATTPSHEHFLLLTTFQGGMHGFKLFKVFVGVCKAFTWAGDITQQ